MSRKHNKSNESILGIHREKMRLEYILADFDSTKDNKFNSTYEMVAETEFAF